MEITTQEQSIIDDWEKCRKKHNILFFDDIDDIFEKHNFDYHGLYGMSAPNNRNIVYWSGWSDRASLLFCYYIKTYHLCIFPIPNIKLGVMEYLAGNRILKMSLVKSSGYHYKHPHWLPGVIGTRAQLHETIRRANKN